MHKKSIFKILLITVTVLSFNLFIVQAETNYLHLSPETYQASAIDEAFTVDLVIDNAQDMTGYTTHLRWDSQYLEMIDMEFGTFLTDHGMTIQLSGPADNINGQMQSITDSGMFADSVSGSGTLATFTFKVISEVVETRITIVEANSTIVTIGGDVVPPLGDCVVSFVAQGSLVAYAGSDLQVDEDTPVSFDGTGSNGDVQDYIWTFKDNDTSIELTGETAEYTFKIPGTYTINLEVSDGSTTASDSLKVTVLDVTPPIAQFTINNGENAALQQGQQITFNATTSYDPETNRPITTEWDFSNGSTSQGKVAKTSFEQIGQHTVKLVVTDSSGNSAEKTTDVTISAAEMTGATNIPIWIILVLIAVSSASGYGTYQWVKQ